jgi:cell division protein FtsB
MLKFYQQQSWRGLLRSPLALIILVILCLFLARVVYDRFVIASEMAAREAGSRAELKTLEEREAKLAEKVEYLSNERGIEAEMRRNFDVALEGEQVVIILDKKEEESRIQPLDIQVTINDAPWYVFWR